MQSIPLNQALYLANVVLLFSLLMSACVSSTPIPVPASTPVPIPEDDVLPLEAITWQWTEHRDDETVLTTPIAEPWIVPNAWMTLQTGKIQGKSGCNGFGGNYKTNGKQLSIEIGGGTQMACGSAVMVLETLFLASLRQTTSYEIVGNHLHLLNAAGQPVLFFKALK